LPFRLQELISYLNLESMKRKILLTVILSLPVLLFAQSPDDKLKQWAGQNPVEKLYLHCDREEYLAGQTIWFKAYQYAEFLPFDKSSNLFVELLNEKSDIVLRNTFPVVLAVSRGQLDIPDTLSTGKYILRAYTATMLNHDPGFVFKRLIAVTGKGQPSKQTVSAVPKIRMDFFPEGGNFVAGQPNTIAFKATTEEGIPIPVKGILKNEKGETIADFSSYHDGMGMIDISKAENSGYYVQLENDASGQKYELPKVIDKGVVFRLLTGDDGIHFEIFQPKNDPVFSAAYILGQMQHNVVFKQPLKEGVAALSGLIKTSNLSSGILHITVFNKDGKPLAERLSFIDNKEYVQSAQLVVDTINTNSRGKNHFTLSFTDTVKGNFSVAVTDAAFESHLQRERNIYSSLLLTSDLKGYVHNPAYYFSSNNDSVKYAIDLLMMTNGWRRFKWEQLMKDPLPVNQYKDAGYITLSGQVNLEGTKKPFADKDLLLYIVAADSSKNAQLVKTDANGRYSIDSLIFFGKASVLFSDIRGKKSRFVDIKPSEDSLSRSYQLPLVDKQEIVLFSKDEIAKREFQHKLNEEYTAFVKANGLVLSEVIIKSLKKSPLQELEDKYTSGAFSGDTRRTFDLMNTDDAMAYLNIFDFLQARVPGLVASRNDNGEWFVYYRQMASISSLGNQGMDIFLDEVLTDAATVAFLPPSQIAMVRVYSNFVGSTGGGAGGALAIYMKKDEDLFASIPAAGEVLRYNGYSIIKEFYSPDYKVPVKNNDKPDQRMTLLWKPDINIAGVNAKIPLIFYNTDRTKSFKVVVEGMTYDGKMLMLEKIITPAGKAF
jgi:hypothetical protein